MAWTSESTLMEELLQRLILNQTKSVLIVQHALDELSLCDSVWMEERMRRESENSLPVSETNVRFGNEFNCWSRVQSEMFLEAN